MNSIHSLKGRRKSIWPRLALSLVLTTILGILAIARVARAAPAAQAFDEAKLSKSCAANDFHACNQLALFLNQKNRFNEAQQVAQKPCDADNAGACAMLAVALRGLHQYAAAAEVAHRSCLQKNAGACTLENQLNLLAHGKDVSPATERDAQSRCDQGSASNCLTIASIQLKQNQVTDAFRNLDKGCNASGPGAGEACSALGAAYAHTSRKAKARLYFKKGCDLGSARGCEGMKSL